ncbi:MAG: manganese-dependent inorganic pyrophosphatase [Candidatus Moranbacteria bacterium]|nr:manganese-dependent inorganic pyrophosphatase [Candidatus Moranbacteria bacterium]
MQSITILGHTNQDTDATVAAIALKNLLIKGKIFQAQAKISDPPNRETQFVLQTFKEKKPFFFKPPQKGKTRIFLVDFNEQSQSPIDFKKATILGLVDHHKLDITISTEAPIIFRVEPLGSSSTIVAKMYQEYAVKMDKKIASLLLAGIISDTLKFSSPTTTNQDRRIAKSLSKYSQVSITKLAKQMFEAKSDLTGIKPNQIITTDYKEFRFGSKKTGIGVLETVNPQNALTIKDDIIKALAAHKKKQKLDLIYFGIVDIVQGYTLLFLISDKEKQAAQKAFKNGRLEQDLLKLPKVVSRKKQIVPQFTQALK